jgi:peptidyl-prolyl cis-trans isomerase B (cyclophilin B)
LAGEISRKSREESKDKLLNFTHDLDLSKIHQTAKMLKVISTITFLITLFVSFMISQEVKKANERPVEKPSDNAEPFDKADVKTMASKCVTLDIEVGVIEIELFPESAPESVRNFLNLTATGMFDTTTFHRVVPGFVIQGGSLWTRSGGLTHAQAVRARRVLQDEPNKILHDRGIVSMARGDEPNSAKTSFFILVTRGEHLDGKFAAFGRVIKGMEVVDAINKAQVTDEKPEKPVRVKKASVVACP